MSLIRKKAYKRIINEDRHPKKKVEGDPNILIKQKRTGIVIDLKIYRWVNKRQITLPFNETK